MEKILNEDFLNTLNPSEKLMATEKMSTLVLRYSIPTIIGMFVIALYNVVDRYFVGQIPEVGKIAFAGIGVTLPIGFIVMGFCLLIGVGAAANISIKMGQRDKDTAEKILGNTLILSLVVSFILLIVVLFFLKPILFTIGASDTTFPYAYNYGIIVFGLSCFSIVSFSMNQPIKGLGEPKRFASTQILGAVINIILDPIFIFVFHLGVQGAAIATIIAQACSTIWVMSYYFKGNSAIKLHKKYLKLNKTIATSILAIGVGPAAMQFANSLITAFANNQLSHFGLIEYNSKDIGIYAMTTVATINMLTFMPVLGINQGVQPIIGFNYGARIFSRVKEAYKWNVIYSVVVCVIGWLGIIFFGREIAFIFGSSPEYADITGKSMKIYLFFLPLIAIVVPSANFFLAIRQVKISLILSLLRQFILLLPLYYLLPKFFGFWGIFYSGPVADFICTIITVYFIVIQFKKIDKM